MMNGDSSGRVERLYVLANDQECTKLMCSNLMYELTHSSPWASDEGLEERHRELAYREEIQLSQSSIDIIGIHTITKVARWQYPDFKIVLYVFGPKSLGL